MHAELLSDTLSKLMGCISFNEACKHSSLQIVYQAVRSFRAKKNDHYFTGVELTHSTRLDDLLLWHFLQAALASVRLMEGMGAWLSVRKWTQWEHSNRA
jgi:hypothetical protein